MKIASRNPPHPGEIIKGLWLDPMGVIQAGKGNGVEIRPRTRSSGGIGSGVGNVREFGLRSAE